MQTLIHRCHHHPSKHAAYLSNGCEDGRSFGGF